MKFMVMLVPQALLTVVVLGRAVATHDWASVLRFVLISVTFATFVAVIARDAQKFTDGF